MRIIKVVGIIILFALFVTGIILIINYSKEKSRPDVYSVIPENKSYVIDTDRKMTFNIYSNNRNSLITYTKINTYELVLDDVSATLVDVEIDEYKIPGAYLIKIICPIPEVTHTELFCDNAKLIIKNPTYSVELKIGSMSFLSANKYELLSYNDLYGSYSYINGVLELVGINITFTNDYNFLTNVRIGGYVYANLSKASKNTLCENEIDIKKIIPSYATNKYSEDYVLGIQSKTYFIPMGYKIFNKVKTGYIIFLLDDKYYYIDTFEFMVNDLDYYEYKDKLEEGVIIYDKAS